MRNNFACILAGLLCLGGFSIAASAEQTSIGVVFTEGAPKDSFNLRNRGNCIAEPAEIRIDLESSRGRLIFDTTGSGAGVEVFQPFEIINGRELVSSVHPVRDGDNQVIVHFTSLPPKSTFAFTIDVDDRLTGSELGQIRITGSEIEGATVTVRQRDGAGASSSRFSTNASAIIDGVLCVQ